MSCAKLEAVSPQQKQYSNDYVLFIDTAMGHQWLSHPAVRGSQLISSSPLGHCYDGHNTAPAVRRVPIGLNVKCSGALFLHSMMLPSEPEEEQAVAEQEQQADSLDERHESMQIEEVSMQTPPPSQQGKQDTAGTGMVQSVMGAAKSFFGGGKPDEVCRCYQSHSPVAVKLTLCFRPQSALVHGSGRMTLSDIACEQHNCQFSMSTRSVVDLEH